MKIGIISDTHDDMAAVAAAVHLFNEEGVVQVLHAGDIVSPFTFDVFRNLRAPLGGIYGNNDGDRLLLRERSGGALHVAPHFIHLGDHQGVLLHEPPLVPALARSGAYRVVIYGHTHVPDVRMADGVLVVNPGKAARLHKGRATVALLETETLDARIVDLLPPA